MMWFFAILIVLALGGIALVAAGHGAPLSDAGRDLPESQVPAEGDLSAQDLRRVRFPLAFRGYRMADVDALLDRLAEQREREEDGRDLGADAGPLDLGPADPPVHDPR